MKLLLHSCCGPCAIHIAEGLKDKYEVSLFFCESNIHPKEEYEKRLKSLREVAELHKLQLFISSYDYERWKEHVKHHKEPEGGARCECCFFERLQETANAAKRMKYGAFATTLTVSPHKNAKLINQLGKKLEKRTGIKYIESDFKKKDGFHKSMKKSKKHKIYRQNYCGCEFSKRQESPKE